ncbi:ELWxxDGT repeat protein, partial [Microcystis sp. M042S1]|uniref:beta strand repeat-containing protein n=1 Tax=Microcystis sp. M042S1 TaxID=2771115 RepID=UPI002588DEF4
MRIAAGNAVLIDVVTGSGSSSPQNFTNVNGTVFFTATNSANGTELWKLDASGNPVLVKDIRTGSNTSSPSRLFAIGNTLYLTADNGINGVELWVSDGTSAGTVLAKDINERSPSSNPRNLIDINGTLYFTANNGVNGERFYKIDPTTGQPVQLSVPNLLNDNAAYLDQFTRVGDRLYFRNSNWNNDYTIYRPLYTIDPATGNVVQVSDTQYVQYLTNVNGTLYFQGYNSASGYELYRINNTTGNAVLIDVVTGSGSSSPQNFTNVNGTVFFTANNSANGTELWKLDASGNPVLVKDIRTGSNSSSPTTLYAVGNVLYFTADDGVNGRELWRSDGTAQGTVPLEIYIGSSTPNVSNLIDLGGVLYFTANNPTYGTELWRINSTTGNPEVVDVHSGASSSSPANLTNVNGTLYFTATTSATGTELYRINNTTGNPVLIDINSAGSGSSWPSNLTNVNGTLYFQAYTPTSGYELWRIDPATGTPSVVDVVSGSGSSNPYNLLNANGVLYFSAYNNTTGYELWKVDPTTGNPVFLKDIYVGSSSSNPGNLTYSNGKLYFSADSYSQGIELWQTDGTPEGTALVKDINATTLGSSPSNFIKIGDILYFTANDDVNGTELWRANPATGVVSLLDIYPGSNTSSVSNLTDVNGTLYFTAFNGINGTELYRIDNTTGNPVLIDINSGSGYSWPSNLTNVNGTLYFQAYTPTSGYELWRIDPTTGNPSVIEVVSGSGSSSPQNLLNANGVLYFTASNSANGRELWKLDPTTGNPVFLKDIYGGSNSSNPGNLTYSNGKLYFTADNGVNGVELWTVNVDQITTIGVVQKTGDEDQVIPFTANDFASVFNSGSGVPLAKIKIINLPSNGLLKLNNSPVAVDQEIAVVNLGNLTFTPNTNYNGIAGFTWNGSDGTNYALNPSTVALTINSINDVPTVANPITDTSIFSNRSSNFTISANTFQDSDVGDSLTYSATLADGSTLPSWLTFNDRTFSGNPSAAQAGQYDLKVIATDQSGASTSDSFVLSVVNSAPWNITLDNSTVPENSANNTVIGLLSASDNNTNDTHTFTLINNAGGRFAIVNNQLVVADGSLLDYETNTQHTIRVKATDNTGLSYERNLTISISNVADDLAGVLSFTAAAFSVNENGTLVNAVTLQRTNGSEGTVSVNVLLSNGTAVFPNDYNSLAVPVVFGPGETSKTVTLPIVNDSDFEGNETLNLTLSSPTGGATLGTQTTATLTIVDNDLPTVSLAVSPASVTEDGTINLVYTFTRTGNTANPLTVSFNVGGTATFNNDYTQNGAASFNTTSGTITFAAGSDTATLTIDPTADSIFEQDETVSLTLVSSANYNRGTTNTVTSTIINDDVNAGVLSFSNSQFSVNENGTPVVAVTVNRTENTTGAVSATINLTNGTATAPSDYNNTPITVNFANGETSKTVTIPIVNDSQLEADETINLSLSNPQGGAILGTQTTAVLTIINDDLPQRGTINLNSSNYTVNENGTANITLTRTNGSDGEVSVILTPSNGSAIAGDDYTNTPITVTFANGETSKTVTIPINNDTIYEPTETVNLTLSNPTGGATLGTQQTA